MPQESKIQEPILVKNPYTGRHINVAPLFDALDASGEHPDNSIVSLKTMVSRIIRRVNLNWEGDATDQKNVNFDLYLLEDMFSAMSEYK
ncbi:hypothetical protein [Spirosoma panaciterrae]|uniref:hypothetical protein n=1 Tax=Spirosoma panaciterrae TaxID=496058 RepID=UPI0003821821|nr:hypothetical protein [Spirosoma panaciterrae]